MFTGILMYPHKGHPGGLLVFFLGTKSAADVTTPTQNSLAMSLKYLEGSGLADIDVKSRTKMAIRRPTTALEGENMLFNFAATLKSILGEEAQVCLTVWAQAVFPMNS
jgi:hypothetical protein